MQEPAAHWQESPQLQLELPQPLKFLRPFLQEQELQEQSEPEQLQEVQEQEAQPMLTRVEVAASMMIS